MLDFHIHPPPIPEIPPPWLPEIERMQQRGFQYKEQILQRFCETLKPGTLGAGAGSGFSKVHERVPFGRHGFHYWNEKALVNQSLQNFDGQEIEIMELLSFSPDRATLICTLEISSAGQTACHEDAFPVAQKSSL